MEANHFQYVRDPTQNTFSILLPFRLFYMLNSVPRNIDEHWAPIKGAFTFIASYAPQLEIVLKSLVRVTYAVALTLKFFEYEIFCTELECDKKVCGYLFPLQK